MKIRRYYTEAKFQAAINDGTIQAFDYLHPTSKTGFATTIDAVYIGSHASHWVCYALLNKYSPRWAYTSKFLMKMVAAFVNHDDDDGNLGLDFLNRLTEFTSLLNRLDEVGAEADKAAEAKAKKEHAEARAAEKAAQAEAIAGAKKEIDDALDDLVDATETAYEVRAQHDAIEHEAVVDQHSVKLSALKEVRRVLDNLRKVTDNGGRPAITDRIRYRQLVDESFNSGGIVKQEITSKATYYDFG